VEDALDGSARALALRVDALNLEVLGLQDQLAQSESRLRECCHDKAALAAQVGSLETKLEACEATKRALQDENQAVKRSKAFLQEQLVSLVTLACMVVLLLMFSFILSMEAHPSDVQKGFHI
jgi:chromosome segregation ATPase